ncbi:MAG: Gfo/Idh/MocA family oxidoreductase, partial [Alistipes sp.]|nr:Gfo/Idh/MocA family oxidoreductase [Alistipes sp.]
TAVAGGIAALGVPQVLLSSCSEGTGKSKGKALRKPGEYYFPDLTDKAIEGKTLKAALVGCGDRGQGALDNLLEGADNIQVTALGDIFPDRLEKVKSWLAERGQIVPDENCFLGFDAYKKVMDTDIDMVLCCTPPVFRSEEFKYATEKGKHSFLEKPIAVDSDGYRTIMATAKQAAAKNLNVITGTQRHHQRSYLEAFKRIQDGMIGQITGGNVYWNQSQLWFRTKQKEWTDMEWMIRDWVNWKWLAGDHIVEQHVHNIDVFMWFTGLRPVKATGVGSRQRRVTGDCYDNFSVDFEFENGIHMHSMCRQIDGCSNKVGEFVQGTLGSWEGDGDYSVIKDLDGNILWQYDREAEEKNHSQFNPYVLEHINWVNHIRRGEEPINQAEECAVSSMAEIMGREAAYTGQTTTWDETSAAAMKFLPEDPELKNMDMSKFTVPVPGTGK